MHFHFFILEKLAKLLNKELAGGIIAEAFSQDKDQIVLGFGTPEKDLWLRVNCGAPLPYIWPTERYNKAKRNFKDLFEELYGKSILKFHVVPYERVLMIDLEGDYQIALKMHGLSSNVLVLKAGKVVNRFRQNAEADLEFTTAPGEWNEAAIEAGDHSDLPIPERLKAISSIFEKHFAVFINEQIAKGKSFSEAVKSSIESAKDDQYYLLRTRTKLQFLLFPNNSPELIQLQGLRSALNMFIKTWHQYSSYAKTFEAVKKPLEKHIQRYQGQINSFYKSIDTITNERPPEEIGHIIMANLHQIQQGEKEIKLLDFYHDQEIKIKLKPELNPQQNAERYYQKQKKHRSRQKHLEIQITRLETEVEHFLNAQIAFSNFPDPLEIEINSDGIDYNLMKGMNAFAAEYLPLIQAGKPNEGQAKHGFHEYKKEGYTILCGKSAKQNDSLTFAFSKKDDLWLHARDTPGSHVIIRNPLAGPVPKGVIEYAASIAAKFSKRKNEQLVPVQYTERKHVRKVKNGAPGQVIVAREKVVMVAPLPD